MKPSPIPQFELSFADEPFALVAQAIEGKPVAPVILAEMTAEERERFREGRDTPKAEKRLYGVMAEAAKVDFEALADVQTVPGLAPGSFWTIKGGRTI